ncbi:MAG: hypothetical protein ACXAC2_20015, partial [Candidatus Kariarchaeaceae archaeon]
DTLSYKMSSQSKRQINNFAQRGSNLANSEGISISSRNSGGGSSAFLETETKTSSDAFSFVYNETYFDNTTYTGELNSTTGVALTVLHDHNSYNYLDMDIDAYVEDQTFEIEGDGGNFQALDNDKVYAQGEYVPNLNDTSTSITVSGFEVAFNTLAPAGINVTGAVYNATTFISDIVPDQEIGRVNITTGANENLKFVFPAGLNIPKSNTYNNGSGGFIFFVFYWSNGTSGTWLIDAINDGGSEPDDGPAYVYNHGSTSPIPPISSGWGLEQTIDFTSKYNASYEFDPRDIGTHVEAPMGNTGLLVDVNGIFSENINRTASTDYLIYHNTSLAEGLTPKFNITYTSLASIKKSANVQYSTNPLDTYVNWTIEYINTEFGQNANITKYFLLPNNMTNIIVYNNSSPLTLNFDYTISAFNGINQSITMLIGTGDYQITANTTNLMNSADIGTFVFNSTLSDWEDKSNGFMGVLYPSSSDGDLVKSNITAASLSFLSFGGIVNASLRMQNGSIYSNATQGSIESIYTGTMSYNITLDPDLPIGVWSFQFRWFNGTSAAAISVEFDVLPVTVIEIVTPGTVIDILEGDTVNIEIATLDYSHNSDWTIPGNVTWEFNTTSDPIVMTNEGSNGTHYNYTTSIDTSRFNMVPKTYTVNITFCEGIHVDFIEFEMNVYYRAGTNISSISVVEYGDDFNFLFNAINYTDGGSVLVNDTNISWDLNTLFDVTDEGSGIFNFTLFWNNSFTLGSNPLALNWTLSDYRNSSSLTYVLFNFSFTVGDTTLPTIGFQPQDL